MTEVPNSVFTWQREALASRTPPLKCETLDPSAARSSKFQLGQTVRVAFSEDGLRMVGVVTSAAPLEVRPEGMSESFQFPVVEALEEVAADKCAVNSPGLEADLRALEMAKLCIQQGMPQIAKLYMNMVSTACPNDKIVDECVVEKCAGDGCGSEDLGSLGLLKLFTLASSPVMVSIAEEQEDPDATAPRSPPEVSDVKTHGLQEGASAAAPDSPALIQVPTALDGINLAQKN